MNNTVTANTQSNTPTNNFDEMSYDTIQEQIKALQAKAKSMKSGSLDNIEEEIKAAEKLIESYRNQITDFQDRIKKQSEALKVLITKKRTMNDNKRTFSQIVNPNNPAEVYKTGGYGKYKWLIDLAVDAGVTPKNKADMKAFVNSLRSK